MIYLIGLWANVLPGLLLLLLVGHLAERLQPGYGAATAVILGLGTLTLPLSTLMFSHVFTAFLGFAAFALLWHEREGPPNPWYLWWPGLALGYAGASEYPSSSSRWCSACTCSRAVTRSHRWAFSSALARSSSVG